MEPSITQTLPVIAKVGINESEKSFTVGRYFFNVSSSPLPKPTEMNIAITVFTLSDWIINTLNTLNSPVNFLIVVMTAMGICNSMGIKKTKKKKDMHRNEIILVPVPYIPHGFEAHKISIKVAQE